MGLLQEKVEKGQDEQKGNKKVRVYLVTIIEEGMGNSKDKNYYSKEALQKSPKLFNGAKAYADHPDAISEKTLPERSMKELVGWYSNCFVDSNPTTQKARLRGKLHFFPPAKWLTDMIDTILSEETAKGLFGISINAIGKTRPAQMGGDQVNYVEAFQRVDSADVVTEPAARGKFEKVLESKGGVRSRTGRAVIPSGSKRMREASSLSPKAMKKMADECTAAYNSDSPDEMKQALYDTQKALYEVVSISGKGSGQANEEQYSNINPSGGQESMATKVKASRRPAGRLKKRKMRASDGTGPDNEHIAEPSPKDIEPRLEESDVEDEENDGDVGDFDDFGDSSKKKTNEARTGNRRRVVVADEADEELEEDEDEAFEDESLEDEDEAFEDESMEDEDEDEDEGVGQAPGGSPSTGAGTGAPTGGGAPGSSRMITAKDDDDDSDGDDQDDDGMDDDLGEAEDVPRRRIAARTARRPLSRESGGKRRRSKEASFDGGLGKSGNKALPKGADPTKGYSDEDEDWGKEDKSTSGVGKSYKIKTSRFSKNKPSHRLARKVAHEANRRIEILTQKVHRLRESRSDLITDVRRYRSVIHFHNTKVEAKRLLESAVEQEYLPERYAKTLEPKLFGLSTKQQIREINFHSRLLESTKEAITGSSSERLMESVEGTGARGGAVSRGTTDNENSELVDAVASDGIPMKEE